MSQHPKRPPVQTILIALVLTGAVTAAAYYTWIYANIGVRQIPRGQDAGPLLNEFGALLRDFRFFIGLLAVFLGLTILDRIFGFVAATARGSKGGSD
ncbi:hypothetical protein E1180_05850 [Roseibium denhamense]|uniref:DUF1206 domain-containing protein n=1 Tax=Roseibium denhamense TaxID=76305 RepID=A0ABY1NHK8_9HYPH|nr:hypothetical protein [Roseibium denhamense]MTI05034.1 hypothetical protein [Roseibium denhamense]SMP09937.1 hypothetical protein SAMN06265374_1155 [Roseibium denhamense]